MTQETLPQETPDAKGIVRTFAEINSELAALGIETVDMELSSGQ